MHELPQIIPDVKMLLALTPEELGAKMLFLLRKRNNAVGFHPGNELNELWNGFYQPRYPREHQEEIGLALAEAWAWLNAQGLIVQDADINGQNGWRRLSRRAQGMKNEADLTIFKIATLLPREILHPKIADQVWLAFMRGEFDVAAFQAMKAVEVSVRTAAQLGMN